MEKIGLVTPTQGVYDVMYTCTQADIAHIYSCMSELWIFTFTIGNKRRL